MNVKREEIFDFKEEDEIEELVRNCIKDFDFENEEKKENTKKLLLSILYYVLATSDEKNMNAILKIVSFNVNSLNSGVDSCLFSELMDNLEKNNPNHLAVQNYKDLKAMSINDLLEVFKTLNEILND